MYVAGDSTASVYATDTAPRAGWGQALPVFAAPGVTVDDRALSGASPKSYADLGLLDHILDRVRPGDWLLISFGHNDEKTSDPARGTDPYTTYQAYLRTYLDGARQRGAHPVLVTSVERRRFDTGGGASDNTHFAAHGAIEVARLVARSLDEQRLLPAGSLRGLRRPVPDDAVVWPAELPEL